MKLWAERIATAVLFLLAIGWLLAMDLIVRCQSF